MLHVPRAAKERALAIDRADGELGARLGHAPTVQEIGGHLELGSDDVAEGLEAAQAYSIASLDEPLSSDGEQEERLASRLGAEDERYELIEDAMTVRQAMRSLPRRDLLLLRLRFGKELSQREIGARMGISQMQVSRLLRRALGRLRTLARETGANSRASSSVK